MLALPNVNIGGDTVVMSSMVDNVAGVVSGVFSGFTLGVCSLLENFSWLSLVALNIEFNL